jgi:N-acetylmuramic acid 6-phosphate etherase
MGRKTTEERNPAAAEIDRLPTIEMLRVMNNEDAKVAAAVGRELPRIGAAVDAIAERLERGGRLIYVGAGSSGRLGMLDASGCAPTFGVPPGMVTGLIAGGDRALREPVEEAEDSEEAGHSDLALLAVMGCDAVVGLSASGSAPYVLGAMAEARARGSLTVGLACNRGAPLEEMVDIAITPLVGPEVIAGSTRLKAGTAQKMVLNMLSTGTMIRLGKTYGDLMVDLQASNRKLRERARRIVAEAAGLREPEAAEWLERCDGEVKTAIVCCLAGVTPEEARMGLQAGRGRLRDVLSRTGG